MSDLWFISGNSTHTKDYSNIFKPVIVLLILKIKSF